MHVLFKGTVTDVPGFKAAGIASGVKSNGGRDLALIYSEVPAVAAATFTQNSFRAAPVELSYEHLQESAIAQAVVINSGNANACTGEQGYQDAVAMCSAVGEALSIDPKTVLVASTGVIGVPLEMEKINQGIEEVAKALSKEGGQDATNAIRTTDTFDKNLSVNIEIGGANVTIGGMAKGSGMIHPNMATMIGVLTTNANIDAALLQQLFSESVEASYNMVSVDGDTSTNDTAMILANGLAQHTQITDPNSEGYRKLKEAVTFVNTRLAQMIARDGEGATKLIEATVTSAHSRDEAREVAKSVITSSLVKTAIFGEDGNWGRIICAIGNSGAQYTPNKVTVSMSGGDERVRLIENGAGIEDPDGRLGLLLKEDKIIIEIDLAAGEEEATAWGCDLSYDYIKINADYRT